MLNSVRAGAVIFLLCVAAFAGSSTGIVWDAGGVTGRDVYSARGNGKKIRLRTGRSDEDATLLTVSPNGRRMAWWLIPPGQTALRDLVVARTAGGRGRNVTEKLDGKVVAAKFSGDSKHLLFVHEDPTPSRTDLWRTNARGKGLRNLTREVPGKATGTLWVSPYGAEVLVEWEFPDRPGLVLVDVKRGVPSILNTGLPDGEPGGYAFWPAAGVLHFTWRETGAEKDDLWQLDETGLVRRVEGIALVRAAQLRTMAARGAELIFVAPERRWSRTAPAPIVAFAPVPVGTAPVVVVDDGGRLRVLALPEGDSTTDLLPNLVFSEVEEIRVPTMINHVFITVREGGARRIYMVVPSLMARNEMEPLDIAEGLELEGTVGAFRTVLPDGTMIFSMLAEHGSTGELHVLPDAGQGGLIARTGLVGLPGRAVFSEKTGDVLFNVIAMPDADNRVFLWDRKKDKIRALTPEYQRPGTFLFTR